MKKLLRESWAQFSKGFWRKTIQLEGADVYPLDRISSINAINGGVRHPCIPYRFKQLSGWGIRTGDYRIVSITNQEYLAAQPLPAKSRKGPALYAGPFFFQYGHCLAESIHRLWAWLEYPGEFNKVLVCPQWLPIPQRQMAPHVPQLLDYFGIPVDLRQYIKQPLHVGKLIVPAQASILHNEPIRPAGSYLKLLEKRANLLGDLSGLPEKLYICRSGYINQGSYAGERYLEQLLARDGYHVLKPETLPLREQLRYLRAARKIIAVEGSALHSFELFGSARASITIIQRRSRIQPVMRTVLEPRVPECTFFEQTQLLPPMLLFADQQSRPLQAMMWLNAAALVEFLRAKKLARLAEFSLSEFQKHEAADVVRYLEEIEQPPPGCEEALRNLYIDFRAAVVARNNPRIKDILQQADAAVQKLAAGS